MRLDKAKAEAAIQAIADRLGMGLMDCASRHRPHRRVPDGRHHPQDDGRQGLRPARDFVLFAFGGAGPAHSGIFARELGVAKVVIPQRETASTWCAFGAASADVLTSTSRSTSWPRPSRPRASTARSTGSRNRRASADGQGRHRARAPRLQFSLDMRHKGQINEVEVALEREPRRRTISRPPARPLLCTLRAALWPRLFFPRRRVEIVTFACAPRRDAAAHAPGCGGEHDQGHPTEARRPSAHGLLGTTSSADRHAVYDGAALGPGNAVAGPAVSRPPTPPSSSTRARPCASTAWQFRDRAGEAAVVKPLSARSWERAGPGAQLTEGEVRINRTTSPLSGTHLTRAPSPSSGSHPLPPQRAEKVFGARSAARRILKITKRTQFGMMERAGRTGGGE